MWVGQLTQAMGGSRLAALLVLALSLSLQPPPAASINSGVRLYKCCPQGQTFKDATLSECAEAVNAWSVPAVEDESGNIHFGVAEDEIINGKPYSFYSSSLYTQVDKVSVLIMMHQIQVTPDTPQRNGTTGC